MNKTCFASSVQEVRRRPGSESESSDVEGPSGRDHSPPTTPRGKERKAIGRSTSVSSTSSFIATPEWVRHLLHNFAVF